jgi:hypothetical protein
MLVKRYAAGLVSPTGFAATHCRQCKNGWTRTGTGGGVLTVCLLDFGAQVLADMASCDRFEPREPTPD